MMASFGYYSIFSSPHKVYKSGLGLVLVSVAISECKEVFFFFYKGNILKVGLIKRVQQKIKNAVSV